MTVGPPETRRDGEGSGTIRGDWDEQGRLLALALELCERPAWVENWRPPVVDVTGGAPTPYFPSGFPLRLCSGPLREAIDRNLAPADVVQWLPVRVVDEHQTEHDYAALHFPEALTRSDEVLAARGNGALIFGFYDPDDIKDRRILPPPGPQVQFFVVADDVIPDLIAAGLTRRHFFPVPGFE